MPKEFDKLGWKLFFILIGIVQSVTGTIVWRTYDSIKQTNEAIQEQKIVQNMIVLPKLSSLSAEDKALHDKLEKHIHEFSSYILQKKEKDEQFGRSN